MYHIKYESNLLSKFDFFCHVVSNLKGIEL